MMGLLVVAASAGAGLAGHIGAIYARARAYPPPLVPGPRAADSAVVRRIDLYDWELLRWA